MKPVRQPSDTAVIGKVHKRLANIERRLGEHGALDDRAFSINGFLSGLDGENIAPLVFTTERTLLAIGQDGPDEGSCDVIWFVNGTLIDTGDLPYSLVAGDRLAPQISGASDDAKTVSATFTLN